MKTQTFNKDTIVFFDRTEFNLKGYEYFLEDNSCYISERFLPKLEHDIGTELFNDAVANSSKLVEFSQDDFQETFNPFIVQKPKVRKLMAKYGITTKELKQEYADRYYSEYLTEATEAQLIDYILNGFNEEQTI